MPRTGSRSRLMSVEIANESGVAVDELALVSVSRFALGELGINPLAELSVLLMDVEAMTELHIKWMDEPGPTDVMSFPMDELDTARRPDDAGPGPALLGDVVLCPAVATEQAAEAGHSLDDELHLLTVHGILHLLGYDHVEPAEEKAMFRLQNDLLDAWREHRAATAAAKARLDAVDNAVLGTVGLCDGPRPEPAGETLVTPLDGMDIFVLILAAALVPIGGLCAAGDAAITMVSHARVEELRRDGTRGAAALLQIVNDRPRYTNLLLLLRVTAELTATVLVTTVALSHLGFQRLGADHAWSP